MHYIRSLVTDNYAFIEHDGSYFLHLGITQSHFSIL